ncbi:MAG: hypothetical protein H0V92_08595 [Pseudonocardiales bacterium]|nr:hypothetical protein [Pseudonocardiales bacterium]
MLKTLGVVVAATAALLVATTPLAYADDNANIGNNTNNTTQNKPQSCNNSVGKDNVVGDGDSAKGGSDNSKSCSADNSINNSTKHKKKKH